MLLPPMTQPQLRAATSNDRLCYVKAGPGSGKTFLASEAFGYLRFVRHTRDRRGIAGVTFARSARRELAWRIRLRWGDSAVSSPNVVATFDELIRRIVSYLVYHELIAWPGGRVPDRPEDSWAMHPGASARPGKAKRRYRLGLDDDGDIGVFATNETRAPTPAFLDPGKLWSALENGECTHIDYRNVLTDAVDRKKFPELNQAIRNHLVGSYCHLIVDEAFDMNDLDIAVLERAIEAGISVTMVGDPWQSLYEFRGSSPKKVTALVENHPFKQIDMPGEHRYTTDDMRELATRLFDSRPFQVGRAENGDEFEVVLAHDWGTLWAERRIAVLPAGRPSKLDGGAMASAWVLLLNELVRDQFGFDASGVGEARRALGIEECSAEMRPVLAVLRDESSSEDDVWIALRAALQPANSRMWKKPLKMAHQYMARLKGLASGTSPPALGLTVHQAKGLEWDAVLFLDPDLSTVKLNVLNINAESHRKIYVALTRARERVRVLRVTPNPHGPARARVRYIDSA